MQRSSRSFIRKSVVAVIALLSLIVIAGESAHAQFETASVLGYVRDSSGNAIAGSTVS